MHVNMRSNLDTNPEAEFHKKIKTLLTKRQQGPIMQIFREAIKPLQEELERVENHLIEAQEQLDEYQ